MTFLHSASTLLPLLVGLPLLAAISCVILRSSQWQARMSLMLSLLQLFIVIVLLFPMQRAGSGVSYRYSLGGWGAPLGIDLVADGLAVIILLLIAVLVLLLTVYSARYFSDNTKATRFWSLWWFLIAGLNAVFVAADAFNIYVALEMIGLAAVALVGLNGTRTALLAALRYALVGLLGSLCYLMAVALLYRTYGTLDLLQLAAKAQANPITWASLSLLSIGLLLKTALLPLHFWLPPAHANAPTPVSAILSALVVKASFYLLLRFWLYVLNVAVTDFALNLLGILGAAAIIWGCIAAFRTQRLKLLVAYSTVAQLGYLFLLFPLVANNDSLPNMKVPALAAVVYFIVAHALAKAAMFLAAGNIQSYYGHDTIHKLQGLAQLQPIALVTFAIAGVSLIGLPPSGGFIAKWLLLNTAIHNDQWWWVIVMLSGGLMAAIYVGRVLHVAFSQSTTSGINKTYQCASSRLLSASALMLAVLTVLLGFNAEWILNLIDSNDVLMIAMLREVQ